MSKFPILIIHGGAGAKPPRGPRKQELETSLSRVLEAVFPALEKGVNASTAVVRAVELLENDPLYNAGYGSKIQSDGHIRMSASLMDGYSRKFSGCINVENVKNPVRLAQKLNRFKFRVLEGRGAAAYARSQDLTFASPFTEKARRHFQKQKTKYGTVGAIAIDRRGRLAAATSTGGRGYEWPHRVSDSPTVAGNFANPACAVSATGYGEQIVDFAVAASVCALVESGLSLERASKDLLRRARAAQAQFGFIALSRTGSWQAVTMTKHLSWALARKGSREVYP